jgi:hypothetical protein
VAVPLADLAGMEARLRRSLTSTEATAAEAAIDDASALVRAESGGRSWLDEDGEPDPRVAPIVLAVALRAFRNPEGFSTQTVGSWTGVLGGTGQDVASGVYLTSHERRQLHALVGALGLVSVPVVRPELLGSAVDSGLRPVDYGGEPLPFLPEGWAP